MNSFDKTRPSRFGTLNSAPADLVRSVRNFVPNSCVYQLIRVSTSIPSLTSGRNAGCSSSARVPSLRFKSFSQLGFIPNFGIPLPQFSLHRAGNSRIVAEGSVRFAEPPLKIAEGWARLVKVARGCKKFSQIEGWTRIKPSIHFTHLGTRLLPVATDVRRWNSFRAALKTRRSAFKMPINHSGQTL